MADESTVIQPTALPAEEGEGWDHGAIEDKWRQQWAETGLYRLDVTSVKRPYYNLMMFPYPSAEKLHIGNAYAYTGADIHGRFMRMHGYDVFEPMGFDAFGIHSENYALKVGRSPVELTKENVDYFRDRQLKRLGSMYDWRYEVNTSDPGYYRWTQWVFLQLFKAGLAQQREGEVNWCPSCLTVLADEQVISGACERCHSTVERRVLTQWYLCITRYAEELLEALDGLDWSERTKTAQRNWIGKSEGARIVFDTHGCQASSLSVFSTRPDTLMGATFLVVAADHPGLMTYVGTPQRDAVEAWRAQLAPTAVGEEHDGPPEGIALGSTARHPLTGEELPLFAAPYVLSGYGTGAIMAVPAHDTRDYAFASTHGLPIVEVVRPKAPAHGASAHGSELPFVGHGEVVNSGEYSGLSSSDASAVIIAALQAKGSGEGKVQYHLRDWLISRQRYWGPPIPIIHCPSCGPVAVPDEDLPVVLPKVENFRPLGTGVSPLATVDEWVNVPCPTCGTPARRETDVSDNFLDSSWYFLRYPSATDATQPFDPALLARWSPVDMYVGGHEHAVLHLMYARFIMRALHDLGHVPVAEPFEHFRAHGLLILNGAKMSKSKGNVVNPDDYIDRYGADALRLYLMFLGPFLDGGDFQDNGIRGVTRFLGRVWKLGHAPVSATELSDERSRARHHVVAAVTQGCREMHYNTAIAALMKYVRDLDGHDDIAVLEWETTLLLLAPFAPFISEELWHERGKDGSVHTATFPSYDENLAHASRVTVAIQINGKLRDTLECDAALGEDELRALALAQPKIVAGLGGATPRRVIVVRGRVVNIVA